MKICSRFMRHLIMALLLLGSTTFAHAVQLTSTWTGAGDGTSYTDAANWSTTEYPRNGVPSGTTYRAVIDGNSAQVANVNYNTSITLDALVVTQGDSFNINTGRSLVIINSGAGTGTIVNSGTIRLNAGEFNSAFLRINGDVELSGGGTITMSDTTPSVNSNNAAIFGAANTDRLTNVDNTISGAGSFGGGQMVFTNRGTIIANNAAKPLFINPTIRSTDNVNSGVLRANGGILNFQIHTINNSGGTIEALNGSVVELRSPTINGGTLQTTGTGEFRTTDLNGLPTFANLTTKGNVQIPSSSSLTLVGNIVNNGTIAINEIGNGGATLFISGDVNLSGGGTITLADKMSGGSLLSVISGRAVTDRLTNADNTIRGAGAIGNGQMLLTNNGTIVARGTNPLVVQLSAGSNVNSSALRAEDGTLVLFNSAFTNTNGAISARAGSVVDLSNSTITGGTLATAGTGVVRSGGFRTQNANTLNNVTNTGNYEVSPSTTTKLIGTMTNRGNIRLNSSQAAGIASLLISGDVTLAGGGTVTMNDAAQSGTLLSVIFGDAADARLTNADNTISGAGGIGNGQMLFTNNSTVIARGTNPLVIQLTRNSTANINTGTLRSEGAGGLVVFLTNLTNAGGTLEALTGSNVDLSSSIITGGTLTTVGTGIVRSGGFRGLTTATLKDVTNTGNFKVNDSASLILQGTMTNRGNIRLASSESNGFASLRISEEVTLNGGGTLTLDDATQGTTLLSIIDGATANARLINADNTISGAGRMEPITLINNGTILPLGANPLLCFSNIINNGIIRVDAGSTLRFDVTAKLTQSAGLLLVNGTFDNFRGPSTVAINGGTLAGTGTISHNVTNGGGTVSPGNLTGTNDSSVGTLTVNGRYMQGADGKLFIQIAGSELTSFDHLVVNGTALFAGTLDAQLLGVYAPSSVDTFKIVDYGSRTGMMKLNVVGRDSRGGFTQKYNLTDLTLTAQGTPTIGVNIQPTQVFTNTVLTATILASPGAPVNSVTYDFQVNGVSKQSGSSNTFDLGVAGNGDKNDIITVVAQTDDDRSNQNQITIQNSKPVAQGSPNSNVRGGESVSIPLTATDLDGDALSFRVVTGVRNGEASIRRLDNGSFVLDYTTRAGANGTDSITIAVSDGQVDVSFVAIVNVTSPAPNRKPVAFSTNASVGAEQQIDIPVSGNDPDGDPITFSVVNNPRAGFGEFVTVNGSTFYRYRSIARFNGTEAINFLVTDDKGLQSNTTSIGINVNYTAPPVNRRPIAGNSTFTVESNFQTDLLIQLRDDGLIGPLTAKSVGGPRFGTGSFVNTAQGLAFRYRSARNFSGVDTIRFVGNDGQLDSNLGTLTINVVNNAPRANNTSATVQANQRTDIPVSGFSPAGLRLTYEVINNPRSGTGSFVSVGGGFVFRYRSVARFSGSDTVTFFAVDSAGRKSAMATITIRVNYTPPVVNRAPIAFSTTVNVRRGAGDFQIDLPLSASDPDGDAITYRVVNNPIYGFGQIMVAADGRTFYRYVDIQEFLASDRVTFLVTDSKGKESNVATISLVYVGFGNGTSASQAAPDDGDKGGSGGSS